MNVSVLVQKNFKRKNTKVGITLPLLFDFLSHKEIKRESKTI